MRRYLRPLMPATTLAQRVVARMYDNDPFSIWLGIERVAIDTGRCALRMTVRPEMLNGFAIAHGGITYSLADSCLAFAANSHGIQACFRGDEHQPYQSREGGGCAHGDQRRDEPDQRASASTTSPLSTNARRPSRSSKGPSTAQGRPWFPEEQSNS
jgi:hypothetical protein